MAGAVVGLLSDRIAMASHRPPGDGSPASPSSLPGKSRASEVAKLSPPRRMRPRPAAASDQDAVGASRRRQRSLPRPAVHREATVQLLAETYVRAQAVVERGYRQRLRLASVARLLAVSPRQLERAYDEIGLTTFGVSCVPSGCATPPTCWPTSR